MTLLEMLEYPVAFLAWTFCLYWIHRVGHKIRWVNKYHQDHHRYITKHGKSQWEWNNLLLYNDTWKSTVDLWITEVVPTIIFAAVTGHWWIAMFYYVWAACLQEVVEHNPNFSIYPWLTSGRWHLIHHRHQKRNFGLFFPIWDILFKTHQRPAT